MEKEKEIEQKKGINVEFDTNSNHIFNTKVKRRCR